MTVFAERLEQFRQEIQEEYEKSRMDRALARSAEQVDHPARNLLKLDEPIRLYPVPPSGELPPPVAAKIRDVTPVNVGFSVDLKNWANDPQRILLVWRLGLFLAEREYASIVKSLMDNAQYAIDVSNKGTLTESDLGTAREKIGELGLHGDRAAIPRPYVLKLWKQKQLWDAHKIPTGYLPKEQRGRYFWGMLDGFFVYSARFLNDIAVVLDRDEIMVRNTHTAVNFDNKNRPTKLILEKWCSSAPIIDGAVCTIRLQ